MKKLWFIFCKDEIMLEKHDDETYSIPESEESPVATKEWTHVMNVTFTGEDDIKTFSIDSPITNNEKFEMCGLRKSFYKLPKLLYDKAGKCHELLYWDSTTKFCGVCGAPMKMHTDISKRCTNCGKEVWPSLATAIIVLIHKGDEVLLVNAKTFRGEFYGLVSGFVETGETLEEAVNREVLEETGLTINNIKYFGSQPWPYPSGLMVGYNADYVEGELHLQREELANGRWFQKDNLPTIPEKLSIARMIIDDWLENNSK